MQRPTRADDDDEREEDYVDIDDYDITNGKVVLQDNENSNYAKVVIMGKTSEAEQPDDNVIVVADGGEEGGEEGESVFLSPDSADGDVSPYVALEDAPNDNKMEK